MSEELTPRRVFSEKEVSRLLKRATELQGAEGDHDQSGLSMDELQQIAEEVGIDPKHLTAAVAELERGVPADGQFHWLGAPMAIEVERAVEGTVSEEEWEEMVEEIRQSFKLVGSSGRVGRSREWTHDSKEQQAQVRVTAKGGKTKIGITMRHPQLVASIFLPAPLSTGLIVPMLLIKSLGVAMGLTLGLVYVAVLLMVLRFIFSWVMQGKEKKAQRLLARLEEIAVRKEESTATPVAAPSARLDATLLAEEDATQEAPPQAHIRGRTSS